MTLDDFRQSLAATEPLRELSLAVAGLWWDGKGGWKRAQESAQQVDGPTIGIIGKRTPLLQCNRGHALNALRNPFPADRRQHSCDRGRHRRCGPVG
jgi:hypothetical protein